MDQEKTVAIESLEDMIKEAMRNIERSESIIETLDKQIHAEKHNINYWNNRRISFILAIKKLKE